MGKGEACLALTWIPAQDRGGNGGARGGVRGRTDKGSYRARGSTGGTGGFETRPYKTCPYRIGGTVRSAAWDC